MNTRHIVTTLLLCLQASAFAQTPPSTRAPISSAEKDSGYSYHSLLAKPRAGTVATELAAAETQEGTRVRREFKSVGGLRVIEPAAGETIEAAVERLKTTGRYEFVEPDYVVEADATPNDPHFLSGDQWALRNVGQSSGKPGADIRAVDGWDIQSSASNVIVALVDSGVRLTHEELAPNLWRNPSESVVNNLIDEDSNGYIDDINGINSIIPLNTIGNGSPIDDNGHGTAVASVIAAAGNNGLGMTGVAWSAQLMALKFLDASGSGLTSDEIECLDYAIAKHAQVINCSFGGSSFSQALFDALKRTRDAGIIVVCSAGNASLNNDTGSHFPSGYLLDNIVAVANTTRTDDLETSSDYGSGTVDLGAPGTSIYVAGYNGNSSYTTFSGTSFSAPMVTGTIALLKAKFPNDNYRETINRVLRSVDALPSLNGKSTTGGRLNLAAALRSTTTRPFNDDFATRSLLSGETIVARSAAQFSTREAGEPVHAGIVGNGSLWWTWTAPRGGAVTLDTSGSAFDTVLAVYTGSTIGALNAVVSNDDESSSINTSKTTFTATAGTTYQIAVDRKSGTAGLVVLHLNLLSANDAFASAQVVNGLSWSVSSDNRSATRENGEPHIKNNAGGHSVWYKWTAPKTRRYHIATFSSDFNTMLGVYTGTDVTALSEVSSTLTGGDSNFAMNSASLTMNATAGTVYYFVVDSEVSSTGSSSVGTFTLSCMDSEWEFFGIGPPTTVAAAPDGTLQFGDSYGYLYGLNSDGSKKWSYLMTGYGTYSAPAVASDGTVYIGDDSNYLHAVKTDGTRKWRTATSGMIQSSPAIASDGTVYARSDDGRLYAFKGDTGVIKWSYNLGTSSSTTYASPSIAPDGTIYCGGANSKLYALTPDGVLKWSYATDFIFATPAIDSDGTLYLGVYSPTNKLLALKPDGTLKWSFTTGDSISSSVAIGADGTIYFGCADKNLYALTSGGQLRWSCATGDAIRNSTPAIASDGTIYTGCTDGKVYAIGPDGTVRRTYATAGDIRCSPLLLNGRLYIASYDYRLYAIDVGQVSATSPWPMHHQNALRSGRAISQTLAISLQPRSQTAPDGSSVTFSVGAVGTTSLSYQWRFNGTAISGATSQSLTVDGVSSANAGQYTVVVTDPSGSTTSSAASLTVTPVAPVVTTAPQAQTIIAGNATTLTVFSSGTAPLTYQWFRNGAAISGATSATYTLPITLTSDAGNYTVAVTNVAGTTTSAAAALAVNPANTGRLANLSILTSLGDGENFTVGAVLGGGGTNGAKPLLVRAVGPTLGAAPFNVPGVLTDPKLALFSGTTSIGSNDDWGGGAGVTSANAQVGAFPFSDALSKDAAVIYSANVVSPPSGFTVQVSGKAGDSGLVLAEIYDSTAAASYTTKTPRLINVSVLKPIGTGLTAGFVVGGATPIKVLIRAVGPSLSTLFGFPATSVIADPKLELFDATSKSVASNDNWGGLAALMTAFGQVGAFSLDPTSKDAAILATLTPGNYTVQVTPATGDSGVALVELYEVP